MTDEHTPRASSQTTHDGSMTTCNPRAVIDHADPATHESVPPATALSVWATAQTSPAAQRKGRYVAESTAHPAKMLPAVAAHAIAHYTEPGDLVLDPMCGIGTTLIEA
ncbi:MAG: DNA methyltransferase, partial [Pseudonocardiaceae bacterium]